MGMIEPRGCYPPYYPEHVRSTLTCWFMSVKFQARRLFCLFDTFAGQWVEIRLDPLIGLLKASFPVCNTGFDPIFQIRWHRVNSRRTKFDQLAARPRIGFFQQMIRYDPVK